MKKILILLFALLLAFNMIACSEIGMGSGNGNDMTSSEEKSTEERLKEDAQLYAGLQYRLVYGQSATYATVSSCSERSDGTWKVAGKIHITDEYGDQYSANWHIICDASFNIKDSQFDTPRKVS